MWARLVAVALVVGVVAGALEVGGALRPARSGDEADEALPPGQYEAEEEWAKRVNAICKREKQQARTIRKAFRNVRTARDFELLFENALRMGKANVALFSRLDPPLTLRREAKELRSLLRTEENAAQGLLDAFRDGRRQAFERQFRILLDADERSTRLLVRLGASECGVKPLRSYPETRRLLV
jgi:hypothetical protein